MNIWMWHGYVEVYLRFNHKPDLLLFLGLGIGAGTRILTLGIKGLIGNPPLRQLEECVWDGTVRRLCKLEREGTGGTVSSLPGFTP